MRVRRRRHAEIPLLRRVRTFLSETTPRFVTFCKCLSLRNLVARGAGMVLRALIAIDSKRFWVQRCGRRRCSSKLRFAASC